MSLKQQMPERLSRQRPVPYQPSRAGELDATQLESKAPKQWTAWDDLKEQATLAFSSGLLPRSVDSREKAITVAMMGKELGLSPMQALCGIYVVNGMIALRGALMLRLIYERVPGARITVLTPPEKANEECVVEMCRPNGKAHNFRFGLDDARKAGFLGKPIWQQHTATMLRWSAIRTGARVVFADAIAGCYMEDEIPGAQAEAAAVEAPELPQVAAPAAKAQAEPAAESKAAPAQAAAPAPVAAKPAPVSVPSEAPHFTLPRQLVNDLPRARRVTEKQINRLFAIARGGNWPRQEVTRKMEEWFSKTEPKELNWVEYDKLCNYLLEKPHASERSKTSAL